MLRKDQRVWIGLLDIAAELLPEVMIIFSGLSQIGSHVKSPSIHIIRRRNPFTPHMHNIIEQRRGFLIVQLRQRIMSPPAIIMGIIRPLMLPEFKESIVRTVLRHKCSLFIAFRVFINTLSIQPFIERTTVIKHTVQNDLHAPAMNLFHKLGKKPVTCFQIFLIRYTADITGCSFIRIIGIRLPVSLLILL